MKKLLLTFCLTGLFFNLSAQVKLRQLPNGSGVTNYFQVGYDVYTPLMLGSSGTNDGTGSTWGIEHFNGGLNFWKPFPSLNYGDYKLFIGDNGDVGIGNMPDPSMKLHVFGNIKGGAFLGGWLYIDNHAEVGSLLITSDVRLKSNITPLSKSLEKLILLNGKSYAKSALESSKPSASVLQQKSTTANTYDDIKTKTIEADEKMRAETETKNQTKKEFKEIGFLAQEMQEVFPELVVEGKEGILSINYIGLIPVIIEALKEQKLTIDEQKELIQELQKEIQASKNKSGNRIGNSTIGNETGDASSNPESTVSAAKLEQNNPNPFNQTTKIGYFVPEQSFSANLYIYDMNGTQKEVFPINQKGQGSITINSSKLSPGMYLYTLIVDGKEVDTKRMILTQ